LIYVAFQLLLVTVGVQAVTGREELKPEHAPLVGLGIVVGQEFPTLSCRNIDVLLEEWDVPVLAAQLMAEACALTADLTVAYRDGARWAQTYAPLHLEAPSGPQLR